MLNPVFPYKSNQLILSSDRVVIHSKNDAIFLFGKEAVSLSSVKTINLDPNEKILIDCKKIELGNKAEKSGQPVVLGTTLNVQLINLLRNLSTAGMMLSQASESNLGATMPLIAAAGKTINQECNRLAKLLERGKILSKNTFTR